MRFFTSLFVAVILTVPAPTLAAPIADQSNPNRPIKDKWALVVGISQFQNPKLKLLYAAKDAQDFSQYLIKEGNFAADHVKLLTDGEATQKRIMSELGSKWLPHMANPDDLVVIFISSHGSPADMDIEGVNYLVAHDTDVDDLYTTGIEMQDLIGTIKRRVHSDRVVLILDACHSGAADTQSKGLSRVTNVDAAMVAQGTGQLVICSSMPNQVSWELKDQPNSVFTRFLIDGLRKQGSATKLGEAYGFMKDKVQETVLRERGIMQTPVLKSAWKGNDLILASLPTAPRPGMAESKPAAPNVVTPAVVVAPPTVAVAPPVISTVPTVPAAPAVPAVQGGVTTGADPAKVQRAGVSSPMTVAILPFAAPLKVQVQNTAGMNVLWGWVKNPAELAGIENKFTECLFRKVRSRLGDGVLGPRVVQEALQQENLITHLNSSQNWTTAQWQKLGKNLGADYILCGGLDEVGWATSTMANRYTFIVSARMIDARTGLSLGAVEAEKIYKSTFHGDAGGGRNYFDQVVAVQAADKVSGKLLRDLPDKKH